MKILSVVGARPQFVKAAAISRAIRARNADASGIKECMVHTGQHFDSNMSQVFFDELEITPPERHLGISGGSHGEMTGRMLPLLESTIREMAPAVVLVYGDTNSTLAATLAAVKLHVPVAHVEAGLRSFNRRMPEEINRVLVDHAADVLLAPTEIAVAHLAREGIAAERVHLVGDVMFDVIRHYGSIAGARSEALGSLGLRRGKYVLATIHRAENTDDEVRLRAVFGGLAAVRGQDLEVVVPLHPRTKQALARLNLLAALEREIRIVEPLGYLDMLMLQQNARLVVTDSGGVQKEAFFCAVPCVTLRDETEWTELVSLGWNTVVAPLSVKAVQDGVAEGLSRGPGKPASPYGDGNTSSLILDVLVTRYGRRPVA